MAYSLFLSLLPHLSLNGLLSKTLVQLTLAAVLGGSSEWNAS